MNPLFFQNQFYAQFRAPNADELTSYVLNKTENYSHYEWAEACVLKTITCPHQEVKELLSPSLKLFSEKLCNSFDCYHGDPWISCYENGSYQEIHDHDAHDFVSVFFPQEQEDDFGRFYFYDRYGNTLNKKWKNILNVDSSFSPIISPGDIIFFHSTILHGVTTHRSKKIRKTLSCNYNFD